MIVTNARQIEADSPSARQWRPAHGLVVEEIGDEYLVLNKARGRIHQFNHTAGIVWRGIMHERSLDEISQALVERYEVPDFRARKDALKTIEQLKILKLITHEAAD